ncbi:N-acetylglutaminylglutamine amidotransferase [Arthrobacter cheniae]|uniref:asparagine synthase (glutamine-hydrolyzing) n=1 Tax=Arthrobacter cheniae TaxID=1258888 RepID=A0A3A5MGK3_9MICC|nr:N-acetylglutaminylglutamine amidotransferase [Arthrobacter cheniae]RJT83503.1 N-acetylglutaminylglutamine amidotransferase [Arthrobacter cheniae]
MCGIAGEIAFRGHAADQGPVARMVAVMDVRGPDGEGSWTNGWVALGHRRLTVIDLSDAGAQPMHDPHLGLTIVFNGCIYNYPQLRAELGGEFTFSSTSDTEVILKAYARWGEDFVDHLVGMFAVAIVDERRSCVVLARDRLGIKPLYVAELPGRLRFASTLPALVAGGGIDTTIDEVALHHYLSWHSIVPAPRTILRGVRKVPPATVSVIHSDGSRHDRVFWKPDYVRTAATERWTAEEWQDAIHAALRTAVQRRLVSDVPVGVLLSGGVDSSLIVALLAELGQQPVSTFSIGFDSAGGEQGDEFQYSDLVAATYGTDHHRIRIDSNEIVPAVGDTISAMTEPMGTQDVTGFYLLSKTVSEHIKVVQSGQGADEVFAGYAYHQPAGSASRASALETFRGAFLDRTHDRMPDVVEPEWLYPTDVSRELLETHLDAPGAETALDAVLRLDTHLLLVDDPVKRVDSMTMAWGLEARVPFLDQDVVELAAHCPPELKATQGGKGILKDVARKVLPSSIIDRPKGYFPVPPLKYLGEPLLSEVSDALHAPEAKQRGLFRPDYVEELLAAPNANFSPGGNNLLWQLGVLEMWLQRHRIPA